MSTPPRTPSKPKDAEDKPIFNERELKHVIAAMMSLKTGVPDIDYSRFQKHGEFNTLKTAQNTWGVLKRKLLSLNPDMATEGVASTPKKTPAKRTKKVADEGDDAAEEDDEGSVKKKAKTPRKKKGDADAEDEEAGIGSPVKKKATPKATPKKTPAKKGAAKKSEAIVKEEEDADDTIAPAAEEPKTPPPAAENIKMEDAAED